MPWTAGGEAAAPSERHVQVKVRRPERGKVVVTFVEPVEAPRCRRYVLISKADAFPTRDAEDLQHWVKTFPANSPETPTVVVVTLENGLWAFVSEDAFLTYGLLDADAPDLKLPSYAGEFGCVRFETRTQVEGDVDNVAFVPEVSELPLHVQDAYRQYYAAYAGIDGHELAWQEVQDIARPPLSLTYGESHFVPVFDLLRLLGVGAGDVVVDLGSGTGRVILAAALAFPQLGLCRGVELQRGLHDAAERARSGLAGGAPAAPVALECADFLEVDWADATLVFAMSLCFPEEMLAALERQALRLRPGALLVTMHYYFGEALGGAIRPATVSETEPRHAVPTEMSFGETPLYVFRREAPCIELDAMD